MPDLERDGYPEPESRPLEARVILPAGKRHGARLWWALWRVHWAIGFRVARRPLPDVMDWLARRARAGSWDASLLPQALFVIERILRVPGDRPHTLCLPRSLLLCYTLFRMGLSPRLNVGVDTSAQEHGHAWVTVDGRPFMESRDQPAAFPLFLHDSGWVSYWTN